MVSGVDVGTAIVSYIEPARGRARDFNRWYERDHFPATVLAAPGAFAGARYVATRACKQLRPPAGTLLGDPGRGSYLALAWVLPGMQERWDAWVVEQMAVLREQGRLFDAREHVHTAVYRKTWEHGAPAVTVLDHGYAGVVVAAVEPGARAFLDAPATVGLASERTIVSSAEPPAHDLVIAFCDGDPCAWLGEHAASDAKFVSPFVATIPGTDAYTEEL